MANIVVCFRIRSLSVEEVSPPSTFSLLPLLDERSHIAATYLIRSIARSLNQPNPWHYLVSLRRRLHIWLSLDHFHGSSALDSSIVQGIRKCLNPPLLGTRTCSIEPCGCQQAFVSFVGNRLFHIIIFAHEVHVGERSTTCSLSYLSMLHAHYTSTWLMSMRKKWSNRRAWRIFLRVRFVVEISLIIDTVGG